MRLSTILIAEAPLAAYTPATRTVSVGRTPYRASPLYTRDRINVAGTDARTRARREGEKYSVCIRARIMHTRIGRGGGEVHGGGRV